MSEPIPNPAEPGVVDVAIVGAGIVGLATAHRILAERPGLRLVVLEKEPRIAAHQTGRNSGVLHSGIYYAPGSLKARTAIRGREAMQRFCAEHGVPTKTCGKVIVATRPSELERLRQLQQRAGANRVRAQWIEPDRLGEIEPHAAGLAALHVPDAGIVHYTEVCHALLGEVTAAGGELALSTSVDSLVDGDHEVRVGTVAGEWRAAVLVNCAGLQSDRVAALQGPIADGTHIVPFRGEYFALREERRHLVRGLIYPVPDPAFPFLGVHLTTTLAGDVLAGPNAVLALAREGYRWRDLSARQILALTGDSGLWRLMAKYWRTGAGEIWRSLSKRAFTRALQRLVPEIERGDLEPYPAGVRAQALSPDGRLLDDFALVTSRRAVHVLNAPSPAATAALEIARTLAAEALSRVG